MPIGIFLITHHEIRGPEIKQQYFIREFTIPQEFVSQLYMAHAGFKNTFYLEMKLNQYKIVSYFTGSKDRKTNTEGILGIVLEEEESTENMVLFLQRNLDYIINKQDLEIIKKIFIQKLTPYLRLLQIFKKYKPQTIDELFILDGNDKFKSCLLFLGNKSKTNKQIGELYEIAYYRKHSNMYFSYRLEIPGEENVFLIVQSKKFDRNMKMIFDTVTPYLEQFFMFSLEILAAFLVPNLLYLQKMQNDDEKEPLVKNNLLLNRLKKSRVYGYEFNKILSEIVSGEIFLTTMVTNR